MILLFWVASAYILSHEQSVLKVRVWDVGKSPRACTAFNILHAWYFGFATKPCMIRHKTRPARRTGWIQFHCLHSGLDRRNFRYIRMCCWCVIDWCASWSLQTCWGSNYISLKVVFRVEEIICGLIRTEVAGGKKPSWWNSINSWRANLYPNGRTSIVTTKSWKRTWNESNKDICSWTSGPWSTLQQMALPIQLCRDRCRSTHLWRTTSMAILAILVHLTTRNN